jgi:hypothetical protein
MMEVFGSLENVRWVTRCLLFVFEAQVENNRCKHLQKMLKERLQMLLVYCSNNWNYKQRWLGTMLEGHVHL